VVKGRGKKPWPFNELDGDSEFRALEKKSRAPEDEEREKNEVDPEGSRWALVCPVCNNYLQNSKRLFFHLVENHGWNDDRSLETCKATVEIIERIRQERRGLK
jgi:uncharacterized C2H2 Zn-finger protein